MTQASGPNPSKILQIGTGFFATKTLLSAVELGLFTRLASGAKTGKALEQELELHRHLVSSALRKLRRDARG